MDQQNTDAKIESKVDDLERKMEDAVKNVGDIMNQLQLLISQIPDDRALTTENTLNALKEKNNERQKNNNKSTKKRKPK